MPWATAIAAATTADAAHQVAEDGNPEEAAIASERAAAMFGLTVISGNVGDHPEAYTRFVSLATYTRLDRDQESWRTAFSFVTNHQPGALHQAIEPFVEGRPLRRRGGRSFPLWAAPADRSRAVPPVPSARHPGGSL